MTDRTDILPRSLAQRGLSRVQAAAYVGTGPTKFDDMVADGHMPRPKLIGRRKVWDRHELDAAFDELPDQQDPNPWDEGSEA